MSGKVKKTDAEWKVRLTDKQFSVTRRKGTEAPFTGKFNDHSERGTYTCVCCGQGLFRSSAKFNSATGWPSFDRPANENRIKTESDSSLGMLRTEVMCSKCDAHLGHVFPDGPPETTGTRYCINSASLDFEKE